MTFLTKNLSLCSILLISCVAFSADDYVIGSLYAFEGNWCHECTKSIMTIRIEAGSVIDIKFKDTSKHKRTIVVENITWDGLTLSFTTKCLETKHQLQHKLTNITDCQLNDSISGSVKTKISWSKSECRKKINIL